MGFLLADIRVLETAFGFDLFIIWLDMGWHGGLADPFLLNFDHLARKMELHGGAMVRCLGEGPLEQVCEHYLGKDPYQLSNVLPGLLITDRRPDEVDESAMRLVVPLKKVADTYGSLDEFLTGLVQFVRERDTKFLNRFEDKEGGFWDALETLELKPNMFGIGININRLIALLKRR